MSVAYLSLGSNVGDRIAHLRDAVARLDGSEVRVMRVSSVYETEYVGDANAAGDPYLNCAVQVDTILGPDELLARTQEIEIRGGRVRSYLHAPRTIDIDIALYDDVTMGTQALTLPHPRVRERAFVLAPLVEIEPELSLPDGTLVRDLLRQPAVQAQSLRRCETRL